MKKNTRGSLIWLRLARFTHQSNLLSNDFLKQFDLTTAQFDVLMQISTYQPLTQSELAEKVTVTQGGISRMLARLEKEGLIERKQDWKTKTISLTKKGQDKLDNAFEAQLEFQSSFFDESLSEEEQKTLYSLISRVQKNSEKKKLSNR
ncbi:MarR family transcriptional regulator [Mammaliicoccus sciuri]|uniref:DNA-binding transcriptional regulator, MarR family n=2 Tax=Sporosarcina newyorkensis TaxID=759851 RepID=A0A1T4XMX5_9BACL|nr:MULTISPECIES: MarR family transcriptional regulator [Sporosarcina]EGQ22673.1 MarR family transcriptional regulator [Sporosarcina newyorkensis 2681]MBY0222576.1 MarR family transcriptional regulator [Sporosarcina aquimarina]SKA90508.1 DNA-binding transcriptional regulator, MarR family [Sporosarcina newyorkensis]